MTYTELVDEIRLLSRRGNIDDKIAIALRMATLRCHRLDFFWKDLAYANVTFGPLQEVSIDVSVDLLRFRQVSSIRYFDPTNGALGSYLAEVDPSDLVDDYGYLREDKYFMAGVMLNIRMLVAANGVQIGYWQNPDVTPVGYNSWIKDDLPDILVQGSLAYLYNMMGKQEEARAINRMVGFEPDPANRAPGMTLVDQLLAIGIRSAGHA